MRIPILSASMADVPADVSHSFPASAILLFVIQERLP